MPRFVHEPILARPAGQPARQNTDPFVFGPSFLYSNCRQFTSQLRPTRLQRLAPGSLILFGSHLRGQFVLDTVLVVASRTPYTIGRPDQPSARVSAAFQAATIEPLASIGRLRGRTAQLYRGVTYQSRGPGGIFSYAPARLDGTRFSRPALSGSRFVNPAMTMGFKTTAISRDQVHDVWQKVTDQVRDQNLDLAIHLTEPALLQQDPTDPDLKPAAATTGICAPAPTGSPC